MEKKKRASPRSISRIISRVLSTSSRCCAQDKPYPAHLPEDLNLRSFIIEAKGGESLLFHAESCDICSLIVDGLQMVIRDQRRAAKKALTLKAQPPNTAAAARPGQARVVLGDAKNLVPVPV